MAVKQKILIVDDDENIAELISLYLTKECFETKIVYDGESALEQVNIFKPDLILLDLMLPGIDGYQVCREIRKTNNIPIIMLSAKGETFDKVLGLELGADDYMIKPYSDVTSSRQPHPSQKSHHRLLNILTLQSILAIILCFIMAKTLKCLQKNLNCSTFSPHLLIRYLQESSFLTIYGDMNISVIQEQ